MQVSVRLPRRIFATALSSSNYISEILRSENLIQKHLEVAHHLMTDVHVDRRVVGHAIAQQDQTPAQGFQVASTIPVVFICVRESARLKSRPSSVGGVEVYQIGPQASLD